MAISLPTNRLPQIYRILDMPIDILYQIFQWLSPKDILQLWSLVPPIKSFLDSGDAVSLWICVLRSEEAPQCPRGITFPKWADLLFGPLICESCNSHDTLPNFYLLRRLCSECLDAPENIVISRGQSNQEPHDSLRNMVFYSITKQYPCSSGTVIRTYWKADWDEVKSQLNAYKKGVEMGEHDAAKALSLFIHGRRTLVDTVLKQAGDLQSWVNELEKTKWAEKRLRKQLFARNVKSRCLKSGFNERDIKRAMRHLSKLLDQDVDLTDSKWNSLRPALERCLMSFQAIRVRRERSELLETRKAAISDLYTTVAKTLPASQWLVIPDATYIMNVGIFKELINDPAECAIHPGSPTFAHLDLPSRVRTEIHNWSMRRRHRLMKLVPNFIADHSGKMHEISHQDPNALSKLDLATTVFVSMGRASSGTRDASIKLFISWEAIGPVLNKDGDEILRAIQFSARGAMAVYSIIALTGLNPQTASPKDLDRLHLRFVCKNCPTSLINGLVGRAAMTWRECVEHFIETNDMSDVGLKHGRANWMLLSKSQTRDVMLREGANDLSNRTLWTCNHCTAFYPEFIAQEVVREHLKTEHGVTSPEVDVDIVERYVTSRPKEGIVALLENVPGDGSQ